MVTRVSVRCRQTEKFFVKRQSMGTAEGKGTFVLHCDASGNSIGGVLSQIKDGKNDPSVTAANSMININNITT